jgi:hypothetical protein
MAGYDQNSVSLESFNDASFFSRRPLLQASAAVAAGLSALVGALAWPENVQASVRSRTFLDRGQGTPRRWERLFPCWREEIPQVSVQRTDANLGHRRISHAASKKLQNRRRTKALLLALSSSS